MEQMLDEHPKEDKEEWITAADVLALLKGHNAKRSNLRYLRARQ